MPTDRLDIDVIVEAITKGFDRAARDLDKVGDEAEDMGRKADRSTGGVSAMNVALGNMAAEGLMTAGRALVKFGMDSITAASDVEEMESKFNAVFKDLAGNTEAELSKLADTINRSKFDLMDYAATFQDTFVPLGFARDAAADMSTQLVLLAEDLASFNNLDTATVVRDLQSALVGNTETLRKYGVVAQEAQIKAKALEMGLWDGTGAMDAQTKAATILALTIEGTSDAQGDAEKTSDSYANKMKGLEAAMKDVQVVIGTALLPTMVDLADTATVLADRLAEALKATGEYGDEVEKLIDKQIDEAESLEDVNEQLEGLEKALGMLGGLGPVITGTFDKLHEASVKYGRQIALSTADTESFELALKDMMGPRTLDLFQRFLAAQELTTEEFYNLAIAEQEAEKRAEEWQGRLDGITAQTDEWREAIEEVVEAEKDLTKELAKRGIQAWEVAEADAERYAMQKEVADHINKILLDAEEENLQLLEEQAVATKELQEAMEEYGAYLGDEFVGNLELTEEETESLAGQFFNMTDQADANADVLKELAVALGLVSDEEADVAFEAMIFTENMRGLATAVAAGDVSIGGAIDAFGLLKSGTYDSWQEAVNYVEYINGDMIPSFDSLDGREANMQVNVHVNRSELDDLLDDLGQAQDDLIEEAQEHIEEIVKDVPPPTPTCPAGQHWNESAGRCIDDRIEDTSSVSSNNTTVVVNVPAGVTSPYFYGESIGNKVARGGGLRG